MIEPPYKLPSSWEWVKLSDIVQELESGGRPKGGVQGIKSGIPSIGGEHLSNDGGFDFHSIRFVPLSFSKAMKKGRVAIDDILIVKDGATTGKTSLVGKDFPYPGAVLNEHVFRLRVYPEAAEQRYLFNYLRSPLGQKMIANSFRGSAQGGINQGFVELVSVPLAPMPEQRRIAERLRLAFNAIASARRGLVSLSPLLGRFRQSVLSKAFRGELTERDPNDEPAEKLLERIREEPQKKLESKLGTTGKDPRRYKYKEPEPVDSDQLPRLPDGWAWSRVDWVADVRLGRQRSPKNRPNKYPRKYLRAANIIDGTLDLSDVKQMDFKPGEFDVYRLRRGDVLLSEGSGSPYEVGKCAVWDERIPDCCIQNTVIRVRSEHISPQYLLYVFMYARYKGDFAKMAKGIEIVHLGAERLTAYKIPLAPKNEQLRMIERIDSLLVMTKTLERPMETALRNTDQLEHSVLSGAFRGELVLQDPNEEPASVLLERIRAQRATVEKRGKHDSAHSAS